MSVLHRIEDKIMDRMSFNFTNEIVLKRWNKAQRKLGLICDDQHRIDTYRYVLEHISSRREFQ